MERYFNTEGACNPKEHYMVRLDERLAKIKKLYVDRGKYFVINRGRQYGKTTTLKALARYLGTDYLVISIDFQGIGTEEFADAKTFVCAFAQMFLTAFKSRATEQETKLLDSLAELKGKKLREMFLCISKICAHAERPIVLIIDEVDNAANNQVFLDFLAQLRGYYLHREDNAIFHSVILAGVYDIKNLQLKIRPDAEHKYNSPWNIAARFNIDIGFSKKQISAMLEEYEKDHHSGMDIETVADEIYQYTSGYPYLVSAICKYLDEEIPCQNNFSQPKETWSQKGIAEAVKLVLDEKIPLFESMMRQIHENPDLKNMLYAILFQGERISYNPYNEPIELANMFGYIVNTHGSVQIANRIFETMLYNLFLSEEELSSTIGKLAKRDQNQFILNGKLDMDTVMKKFVEYFHDIYGKEDTRFVEEYGRKFFLLYLKPIINGTGNYYVEAQTRDARRTDVVVDYLGEQFVIEMKIWRGTEYNERGEQQISDYLDYFHQNKGYLLSFNFNQKKEIGVKTIVIVEKTVVEAIV